MDYGFRFQFVREFRLEPVVYITKSLMDYIHRWTTTLTYKDIMNGSWFSSIDEGRSWSVCGVDTFL